MEFDTMKWVYPVNSKNAFEQLDENRAGKTVFFDALQGVHIGSPLAGEVFRVVTDPRGAGLFTCEVLTVLDDGTHIYNTISGLEKVVGVGTQVKQGDTLGYVGVGWPGSWDVEWTAYLNFADEVDEGGSAINPIELANEMGGIVFPSLETRLPKPKKPEIVPLPPEPVKAPDDKKKLIMIGLAGLGVWYFMKKGKS